RTLPAFESLPRNDKKAIAVAVAFRMSAGESRTLQRVNGDWHAGRQSLDSGDRPIDDARELFSIGPVAFLAKPSFGLFRREPRRIPPRFLGRAEPQDPAERPPHDTLACPGASRASLFTHVAGEACFFNPSVHAGFFKCLKGGG